jgi:hypothetical protein
MSNTNMLQKNNILYYFLISSIHPKKKIFELINTNDKDTYVEAQEILGNYLNTNSLKVERVKIESRDNAFHIYITNKEIVYMSYSNVKLFSSEKNFELFDEINRYLMRKIKERIIGGQSFLIEDEKDEIKDIINSNLEEVFTQMSFDGNSRETENEVLQVNNSKEDINNNLNEEEEKGETIEISSRNRQNNITVKKILKNQSHPSQNELTEKILQDKDNEKEKDKNKNKNKKNESSGEEIIKNKNNNSTLPYGKSTNMLINNTLKTEIKGLKHKNFSKNTLLSKTSQRNNDGLMREKSKTHLKLSNTRNNSKNYSYNKYNINNLNFNRNKTDCCKKEAILVILISIIVLQIAIIPIIIKFYDFSI